MTILQPRSALSHHTSDASIMLRTAMFGIMSNFDVYERQVGHVSVSGFSSHVLRQISQKECPQRVTTAWSITPVQILQMRFESTAFTNRSTAYPIFSLALPVYLCISLCQIDDVIHGNVRMLNTNYAC